MKFGVRKPSIKKSISARTTGKIKRSIKKSVNPLYGKKGMGYINDPEKAVYNKVYNKTTVGARDVLDPPESHEQSAAPVDSNSNKQTSFRTLLPFLLMVLGLFTVPVGLFFIAIGFFMLAFKRKK